MTEINRVSNIDQTNPQNLNNVKKTTEAGGFSSLLGETKSLNDIFESAAKRYDVPVELLKAIGKQESNFNAKAVSRCGAQGVMQLMPATAKSLGVTDSFDAEQNIMGGAKYISGLLKKYDGDTKLALAAYNAGSGNVAKYDGIPPFKETQNYVKKVMGYYQQGTEVTGTYVSTKPGDTSGTVRTAPPAQVQNNQTFLIASTMTSASDDLKNLNDLFSYDDYLRFIDLYIKNEEEKNEDEKEQTGVNYSKDITYNATAMRLLNEQQ